MDKIYQKSFSGVKNAGFTLIELLVVVLIIGILSSIALPQYTKAVAKARFAEALSNLKMIAQAQQVCSMVQERRCNFDELDVSVGTQTDAYYSYTTNFMYRPWNATDYNAEDTNLASLAQANYLKEGVCLCYQINGEIVLNQDPSTADCTASSKAATLDYAKLLNLRDVGGECTCC